MTALRDRPESCLSDLAIDRAISGELAGDDRQRADAHFATCEICARRRTELAADVIDGAALVGGVDRLMGALATIAGSDAVNGAALIRTDDAPPGTARARARARWSRVAAVAVPLAAAAALVLWIALPDRRVGEDGVRTKGGLALELVVRRADGSTAELGADARVAPGDAVRFLVSTDRSGYLAIVGIDAARQVSRYVPDPGAAMPAIAAGRRQVQPGSIVLDDTLGAERFVVLLCDAPVDVDGIVRDTRGALAQAGTVDRIPTACRQAAFVVDKVRR